MDKCCRNCDVVKTQDQFTRKLSNKDGLYSYCKVCASEKSKQWIKDNRPAVNEARKIWRQTGAGKSHAQRWSAKNSVSGKRRDRALAQYGLTQASYDLILDAQSGVCKICKCLPAESRRGVLHVDHSHADGTVRGLLCDRCNLALGGFQDSVEILEIALNYLKDAKCLTTTQKT